MHNNLQPSNHGDLGAVPHLEHTADGVAPEFPFNRDYSPSEPAVYAAALLAPPGVIRARHGSPGAIMDEDELLIPLANGGMTRISASDRELVIKHTWRRVDVGGREYVRARIDGHQVYLHRLIAAPNGIKRHQVDHIDGDSLNNCRRNLRVCNHCQNARNSVGKPRSRIARFKGVSFYKSRHSRPWRATITVNGRDIHLGYFDSELEAAQSYDSAARKYFGEFARPNNASEVVETRQPAGP